MSKRMTLEEQIKDLRDHIHSGPIIVRRISVDALLMSHDRLEVALSNILMLVNEQTCLSPCTHRHCALGAMAQAIARAPLARLGDKV